ncbi:MAG: hypothetical protein AAF962_18900 [Actinomycetota bacterium]
MTTTPTTTSSTAWPAPQVPNLTNGAPGIRRLLDNVYDQLSNDLSHRSGTRQALDDLLYALDQHHRTRLTLIANKVDQAAHDLSVIAVDVHTGRP